MEVLSWVTLAALAISLLNLLTFVKNKQWDPAVKTLGAYVIAVALVFLVAHSDFGNTLSWSDRTLDNMNAASLILTGLMWGASAIVIVEFKKAFDNSDSAVKSPLINK